MNLEPVILKILEKRGISSNDEIEEFLSDKPQKTYNPFLLLNMKEGVDLILSSISEDKNICIYGDYDADGITSTTIMLHVLSCLTKKISYYIPSRFEEGYGLNMEAIRHIRENGADLIITVDCGSVSYEEVEYAKSIGMDIIVTDHHTITDTKADCILINPKQKQCKYPFKDLAGCGVAFKLCQGLVQQAGLPKKLLTEVLDLVGIGTIGDIVPLIDENRTLAKFGLRSVNLGLRPGLDSLIEGIALDKGLIRSEDVAYKIVPHLNASGRMVDAKIAVELLKAKEQKDVENGVKQLIQQNSMRKSIQENTYKECVDIASQFHKGDNFLVVLAEDAHEGIAGIVAGKIKDYYHKPTILVTPSGEYYKGTGRSIEGINLYNLLKNHEDLFIKFGGHEAACGFTMEKAHLEELRDLLNKDVGCMLENDPLLLTKKHFFDVEVDMDSLTYELADQLELLAPYGCKNPRPIFKIKDVNIVDVKYMGTEQQHARFVICDNLNQNIQCVLFGKAREYDRILVSGKKVNLLGTFECQTWRGTKKLQLIVNNIESSKE